MTKHAGRLGMIVFLSTVLCTNLAGATSPFDLPAQQETVEQLAACSDYIAVVELDRCLEPFNLYPGGNDALHVAIYRLDRLLKGKLSSPILPVHHLTGFSPYAERVGRKNANDPVVGFRLDSKQFLSGRRLIVFLEAVCDSPRDDDPTRDRSVSSVTALRRGALLLKRHYQLRLYQVTTKSGVYQWSSANEDRVREAIKSSAALSRPNPSCRYYRQSGEPCPLDVLEAMSASAPASPRK